jgi:hypothetical protein
MLLGFCAQARSGAIAYSAKVLWPNWVSLPNTVSRLESGDVLANHLDLACSVKPQATITRCPQPGAHASEEWFASR